MAYHISLFLYSSICQSLHLSTESTPQFLPLMMLFLIVAVFIVVLVSNRMILRRVRQRIAKIDFTTAMMQKAVETSENEVVRYDLSHRYIYRLFGSMFPEEGILPVAIPNGAICTISVCLNIRKTASALPTSLAP